MVAELLLIALSFAGCGDSTGFHDEGSGREEITRASVAPETTSFSDAFPIVSSRIYHAGLYDSTDYDYYSFTPSESGFYTFSVGGSNHTVDVFSKTGAGSPSLFGTYVISSSETNYGRNHVIYIDLAEYDKIYYVVSKSDAADLSLYTFCVEPVAPLNNGSFELVRYDVQTQFYSFLTYDSSSWFGGSPYSYGYDPNGTPMGAYPTNYSAGDHLALNTTSGYDTTSEYPYTAVGRIVRNGGAGVSTGFMIGENVFATAAHCVSASTHCHDLRNTNISFGSNGEYSYAERGYFQTIYMSPFYWSGTGNEDYDWAICLLDDSYGQDVGYFSFMKKSSANINTNHHFVIDGYKNGNVYQTLSYADYLGVDATRLLYTKCTAGGDSGAPIYDLTAGCVVGIHTGSATTYSQGTYFTDDMFYFARYLIGGNYL